MASPSDGPRWAVSLFLLSFGLWIGAVVFVSAAVLPLLFVNLDTAEAGRIAALIFPTYFHAGLVAGLLACVAAAVLARGGARRWRGALVVVALMVAAQAWSALVVHPEMAAIRGDEAAVGRFQDLHQLSVRLNGVVLMGGLLLLGAGGALFGARRDGAA